MKNISRRDFFKHLTDSVADNFDPGSLKGVLQEPTPASTWIPLAPLAMMSPGSNFPFEFGGSRGVLHSNENGFYAVLENGHYAALRLTPYGLLEVNTQEIWPSGQVLSHATGLVIFPD